MNKFNCYYLVVIFTLSTVSLWADWQKVPASDVDKEFISGNPGLANGVPGTDNSCWLATASNLLAGAGYGNGATIQERAEDIYLDFLTWRLSLDPADTHGTLDGGWIDTAVTWWLGSANNVWPSNPYTVVTVYGNKSKVPWANANGAEFIGNQLRDYRQVGLSISIPRTSANGNPTGGHAITAWGDDGTVAVLTTNPGEVIVADSDRDNGGDFQTYTYDSYTNPNPGGFDEGNGWYFNFAANHWFIKHIATLSPTDSPIDPHDGPTQLVIGSYKVHQDDLESATDLHYTAWTDYNILGYKTDIDWPTGNDPVITESNTHVPSLTRSDIHVDWDLTDHPVDYGKDVTITTEFVLQNWNGIHYDDVNFTYPDGENTKYLQPPYESGLGTDIRVDNYDQTDRLLADDFRCIQTGPITKIYLWGSWKGDSAKNLNPGHVQKFHLTLYSDDPVGDDPKNPDDDPYNDASKPLKALWSGDFDQFTTKVFSNLTYEESFWDPFTSAALSWDMRIWQYEIDIPEATAFVQKGSRTNPLVYWLGVSAEVEGERDVQFGWHTTDLQHGWNDRAVAWRDEYVLTDAFDYGEDQKTHSYQAGGSVSDGLYRCDTGSLRIGNGDSGAYASIIVDVIKDSDKVKLRYRIPWSGAIVGTAPTGATLYVDGVKQGMLAGNSCDWQEIELSKMAYYTKDGELEIQIVDEIKDRYDGDIQITYLEVYSTEKQWSPLSYPQGHELAGQPVDLAFGIVTPTTRFGVLMPRFGWNVVTRTLKETNIPDITGGFLVGAFDVYDEGADSKLLGQYRFVHQYPYTQDPEYHTFTLTGPSDQTGCEYRATNFRFGHAYGQPDAESLWQFHDWMTLSNQSAYLCGGQTTQLTISWDGRLPYPASDITPADEIPDAPECTVFLEADINEDCCVDLNDFAILSRQWMMCTKVLK